MSVHLDEAIRDGWVFNDERNEAVCVTPHSEKTVGVDSDGDLTVSIYEDNGGYTRACDMASGFIPRAVVEELYRRFDAARGAR